MCENNILARSEIHLSPQDEHLAFLGQIPMFIMCISKFIYESTDHIDITQLIMVILHRIDHKNFGASGIICYNIFCAPGDLFAVRTKNLHS